MASRGLFANTRAHTPPDPAGCASAVPGSGAGSDSAPGVAVRRPPSPAAHADRPGGQSVLLAQPANQAAASDASVLQAPKTRPRALGRHPLESRAPTWRPCVCSRQSLLPRPRNSTLEDHQTNQQQPGCGGTLSIPVNLHPGPPLTGIDVWQHCSSQSAPGSLVDDLPTEQKQELLADLCYCDTGRAQRHTPPPVP
jgi:hypothetical protein